MLSDRIETLFTLLQCNNTDIARYAGCSSGNISKLKSGNRVPKPTSRTIAAFAEGVYRYADYEALLSVLCELCGAVESSREVLLSRAEKYDRTSALAELCAVPAEGLDGAVFAEWLVCVAIGSFNIIGGNDLYIVNDINYCA